MRLLWVLWKVQGTHKCNRTTQACIPNHVRLTHVKFMSRAAAVDNPCKGIDMHGSGNKAEQYRPAYQRFGVVVLKQEDPQAKEEEEKLKTAEGTLDDLLQELDEGR